MKIDQCHIITEVQIKTTMKYHLTADRIAIINESTNKWLVRW